MTESALTCLSPATGCEIAPPDRAVVCLGTFDGVHLAHRMLLQAAKARARELEPPAPVAVFTFSEPPSDYLSNAPAGHLSSLDERISLLSQAGAEYVFLGKFPALRGLSPQEFAQRILCDACHAVLAVCGYNFRFGKGGSGGPEDLEKAGVPVSVMNPVDLNGAKVSSTRIRTLLSLGDAEEAARLLTRPYRFAAPVLHGKTLGTALGAPTVNQLIPEGMVVPAYGVYITECEFDGQTYRGVTNVGVRPTVDRNGAVNCETHLLGFSGNLYGKIVRVSFLKRLRGERKFSSPEELANAIREDIRVAETIKL